MRLSIRQALAPMALLVTALASMGMAPVHPAPVAPTASSSCSSYIDWNTEKGVWRINCGGSASCCEYDSVRRPDGSRVVWCDCSRDGLPPECCHVELALFPNQPGRPATPVSEGSCFGECNQVPWANDCGLMEAMQASLAEAEGMTRTLAVCLDDE
jgi:hypothetical protein